MDIIEWHIEMKNYIKTIDPFNHLVSSSIGNVDNHPKLYQLLFDSMDFAQQHSYRNIQCAESSRQMSHTLYKIGYSFDTTFSESPYFVGEFGLLPKPNASILKKDTLGIDLHNSLWSSLFSSSMGPASFWWWEYVDYRWLYKRFKPIYEFCNRLPLLSDNFKPYTTVHSDNEHFIVFENGIGTYYLKNTTEDTIYGWCQDTAFSYQSLRRLTDNVMLDNNKWYFVDNSVFDPAGYVYTLNPIKRPQPSSNSNLIKITFLNVPNGTQYEVHWFNTETGLEYNNATTYSVVVDVMGEKYIHISFPSFIRNLNTSTINNTFGDVAFAIYRVCSEKKDNKK